MGLFSKIKKIIDISNSHINKVLQEKDRLEKLAEKVKYLMILAEERKDLCDQLDEYYIDLKYANPVVDDEIIKIDEKISNKLDDLKLNLMRGKFGSEVAIKYGMSDVKELIQKREMLE